MNEFLAQKQFNGIWRANRLLGISRIEIDRISRFSRSSSKAEKR
jgi:hypothetical protein